MVEKVQKLETQRYSALEHADELLILPLESNQIWNLKKWKMLMT